MLLYLIGYTFTILSIQNAVSNYQVQVDKSKYSDLKNYLDTLRGGLKNNELNNFHVCVAAYIIDCNLLLSKHQMISFNLF